MNLSSDVCVDLLHKVGRYVALASLACHLYLFMNNV